MTAHRAHDMPADPDETMVTHPDALTIAAFVDDTLSAAAREITLEHLAACSACREEVGDVQRLLRPVRRPIGRWSALLAAAAALVLWIPSQQRLSLTSTLTDDVTRATGGSATAAVANPSVDRERTAAVRVAGELTELDAPLVVVEAPRLLAGNRVEFVWRAADTGANYEVVVQDESGGVRYRAATLDTVHLIPRSVLGAPSRLYWRVHARLLDGRERSSAAYLLRQP